ncbi:MAG: type II secretion system protein [Cyanobacteria bacterium P01_D01_bin.156]
MDWSIIFKTWFRCKLNRLGANTASPIGDSNTDGLTLIECLVAIAVIGISMAVTAPMIVLSVATRTQTQRADQALQIAQAEIDRVRFTVINNDTYTVSAATVTANSTANFDTVVEPPENISTNYSTTSDSPDAKGVDIDGDGNADYAAQIFRTVGSTVGTTPVAFNLGVRVYDAAAVNSRSKDDLGVETARLGLTSGRGDGYVRPLAVLYTTVIKSDTASSLCDYNNFINSVNGTSISAPSQCN